MSPLLSSLFRERGGAVVASAALLVPLGLVAPLGCGGSEPKVVLPENPAPPPDPSLRAPRELDGAAAGNVQTSAPAGS